MNKDKPFHTNISISKEGAEIFIASPDKTLTFVLPRNGEPYIEQKGTRPHTPALATFHAHRLILEILGGAWLALTEKRAPLGALPDALRVFWESGLAKEILIEGPRLRLEAKLAPRAVTVILETLRNLQNALVGYL
jgi:hypothetical protein